MSHHQQQHASNTLLFVIVGRNEPLFEAEFASPARGQQLSATAASGGGGGNDAVTRQNYFVLHSALDLVDKAAWTTGQMYLKVVDKVNHQQVSCFLTAGNVKFMLLHGGRNEESVRTFFQDVYELYVKLAMNPFYRHDTPIRSVDFESRVRAVARRYL